jgi:hypothetical protein
MSRATSAASMGAQRRGGPHTVQREVLAALRDAETPLTVVEVVAIVGRSSVTVRKWLDALSIGHGPVVRLRVVNPARYRLRTPDDPHDGRIGWE